MSDYYTTAEVAEKFRVGRDVPSDWAKAGKLTSLGRGKYAKAEVDELFRGDSYKLDEVMALFKVAKRTVHGWAASGKIEYWQTPGGSQRFLKTEVEERLAQGLRPARGVDFAAERAERWPDGLKPCSGCGEVLPLDVFSDNKGFPGGLSHYCRDCAKEKNRGQLDRYQDRTQQQMDLDAARMRPDGRKGCNTCGEILPLSRFGRNRSRPDSYMDYCHPCGKVRAVRERARLSSRTEAELARAQSRMRPDGLKRCRTCLQHKPADQFHQDRSKWDGRAGQCQTCSSTSGRRRRDDKKLKRWLFWESHGVDPHLCWHCLQAPAEHDDHYIPTTRGGPDVLENLIPSCGPCNQSRLNLLIEEWWVSNRSLLPANPNKAPLPWA